MSGATVVYRLLLEDGSTREAFVTDVSSPGLPFFRAKGADWHGTVAADTARGAAAKVATNSDRGPGGDGIGLPVVAVLAPGEESPLDVLRERDALRRLAACVRRERNARVAWLASLPSGSCGNPPSDVLVAAEAATAEALTIASDLDVARYAEVRGNPAVPPGDVARADADLRGLPIGADDAPALFAHPDAPPLLTGVAVGPALAMPDGTLRVSVRLDPPRRPGASDIAAADALDRIRRHRDAYLRRRGPATGRDDCLRLLIPLAPKETP